VRAGVWAGVRSSERYGEWEGERKSERERARCSAHNSGLQIRGEREDVRASVRVSERNCELEGVRMVSEKARAELGVRHERSI
jgi:hypothetical protein